MRTSTLALLLAAFPAAAVASGYSVPTVAPRDLALSGAAVAAQRDAGAVYAMPAALARLDEGLHLAATLSALDIEASWDAPVGPADASTKRRLAPPAGAFAAYATTLRGTRVGFGAGFTTPYGGNVFWADDWPGRQEIISVDRRVYGMYAAGAFQAGPYLRLGGGLIYYRTTEYLKQGLDLAGRQGHVEVSTSGGALSYQLAVEGQPTETIRLALGYRHQGVQDLKGDAAFHGVPDELRPSLPDQDVSHRLTIPSQVEAAVAWQIRPDLLAGFTYTFERYAVYREDRFVGSSGLTVVVPRDYRNGYTVRAGAEYRLSQTIELRAGAQRDVSGVRESTFDPSLTDASSWAGSLGAGWRVRPNVTVDAAFFLALFDSLRATGETLRGTYDMYAWIFSVGATWRPALR